MKPYTGSQPGIRIDLGTLLTVIGVLAIVVLIWLIFKKIAAVPGSVSKKFKGLFGKKSTIETLQSRILSLQEENDRLTLAKCTAEQELDKLRRAKAQSDEELYTANSKLETIEADIQQLEEENTRLIEYCKDLRHRIEIGEKQARRESLETAAGLVKLGADKGLSAIKQGASGGWDKIQTQVVKLNALIAEELRALPSPKKSDGRSDFDPYKDEWK